MNLFAALPFGVPLNARRAAHHFCLVSIIIFSVLVFVRGQENSAASAPNQTIIIEEIKDADVFALNKTVLIKGNVTKGVLTFGGDVIVEGHVAGDIATFGGSVIQRENSFVGGDIIVIGGTFQAAKSDHSRNAVGQTIIYAGYENELRELAADPTLLVAPSFTFSYFIQRVLTAVFWFVVSLVLTMISPGAISRSIVRLNLTSLKIALIGVVGTLTATVGVALGLQFLPEPLSVVIGLMTLVLLFLAYVFGRVCLQAATGKFLRKRIFGEHNRSESLALALGAVFWTLLSSLPFIYPIVFIGLIIISLGVVLTARPSFGWIVERK